MGILDFLTGNSANPIIDLSNLQFTSNDHIRYQSGRDVSGHNKDCWRGIKIQNNISGGQGFTVTIYNLDGNHSLWADNIQMAPKQMKIIEQNASTIKLRGFGNDSMGNSFSDYGLTLKIEVGRIKNATLHMYDRDIEIIYFYDNELVEANNELDNIISESNQILQTNNRELTLKNVKRYADYFKTNKNEFLNFNSSNLNKLEVIEKIAVKATEFMPNLKFPFSSDVKQILVFTLLTVNKTCQLSQNEKYIEDKMFFLNKQPAFMLSLLMDEAETEINKLQIFTMDEDYSVKIIELLSAEIVLTSFLKDRQTLLYNHSLQQLNTGYFYPIRDTNSLKTNIKKAEAIIDKTLLTIL